jgi:hypothetical protein
MPCPYLEGENLRTCAVFRGMMVLSIRELKDYCTTEQTFAKCEFYIKTAGRKHRETKNYNEGG